MAQQKLKLLYLEINLVAGGSGLTPHWQLIHAILSNAEDQTCISLIDWYAVRFPLRFKY